MAQTLTFGHDRLQATLTVDDEGRVGWTRLEVDGVGLALNREQPLVEVLTIEDGHAYPTSRLNGTAIGAHLRYVAHAPVAPVSQDSHAHGVVGCTVELTDPASGLQVQVELTTPDGVAAVTGRATLTNVGSAVRHLSHVTSLVLRLGDRVEPADLDGIDVVSGTSEWLSESRWDRRPVRTELRDLRFGVDGQPGRGVFVARSHGTWSTGGDLPVGGLMQSAGDFALVWQVEHNGGWRWEIGEEQQGLVVGLAGPTDVDHQWLLALAPGESFTTVPATVGVGNDLASALAELTDHRRRARRPHVDNDKLFLIFNDYMNTLMGDPTTEKLLPLIGSAAAAGAEVFCIDAGWYDDGGHWWPSVGAWQPSTVRFPGGLKEVIDHIRDAGMIAGLWLEPEVIGVDSPMATELPDEAFLTRRGVRVREAERFHLDLSNPVARAHLDEVVDRLVTDFGVGFFKMDYNVNPGAGTDADGSSPGVGLLRHNRAQLAWLDGVYDRHPDLIIENCSSGAMRMDPALMSRLQLQSTSDQQDAIQYPPIAAAAPLSILPEQAGNWAYPNVDMDLETTAFAMTAGITGRLYLSGYLDRLSPDQLALVTEAMAVHKEIRGDVALAYPSWPLDLPQWDDPVVALALQAPEATYLTVWQRHPGQNAADLSLPALAGESIDVEMIYPAAATPWPSSWDSSTALLTLDFVTPAPASRVFRITARTVEPQE